MSDDLWQIGLEPWVIQDGNYPDLHVGDRVDFALEYSSVDLAVVKPGPESVDMIGTSAYRVSGLQHELPRISVLEIGEVSAYRHHWEKRQPSRQPESVGGVVQLSIDPFFYFEQHGRDTTNPPLIYGWEIESISLVLPDSLGPTLDHTAARDEERGSYLLGCRLVDPTPKRERFFLGPEDPVTVRRHLDAQWPPARDPDVRDALLAAYSSPRRGYHDLTHLSEVLERLAELECEEEAVVLAAWFHDGVYDGGPDDEERSAAWAETALADDPDLAAEVGRLVRLTASHRPEPGDRVGQVLCDADLAILAAEPKRYGEYVAGVRQEYAHVSDADFRRGRRAVLEDLLAKPHLFETESARDLWEVDARANLVAELGTL